MIDGHIVEDLEPVFNHIAKQEYEGVKGVICFGGKRPGPTIGVSIGTHGNEPVGLIALKHLLEREIVYNGKLIVTLNNIEATKNFFHAKDHEERDSARFIDHNMNRLPKDVMELELTKNDPYEFYRAQELFPIWKQFVDGGLDIHSTSSDSPPMLINRQEFAKKLRPYVKDIPVELKITGVLERLCGLPVIDFYGTPNKTMTTLLEAGQHTKDDSCTIANSSIMMLLSRLGMLRNNYEGPEEPTHVKEYYDVFEAIYLPNTDESFYYVRPLGPFEWIHKDQVIAISNKGTIFSVKEEGYAVMPFVTSEALPANEELLFLAKKIKH